MGLLRGTLLFEEMSPQSGGERWGPVHYAFEMPRERLEVAVGHVRNGDLEVYRPIHFEWMKADSCYFYDPDDNLLEFWSTDPTVEEHSGD